MADTDSSIPASEVTCPHGCGSRVTNYSLGGHRIFACGTSAGQPGRRAVACFEVAALRAERDHLRLRLDAMTHAVLATSERAGGE